jgi:YVTN family beta-propeller protein
MIGPRWTALAIAVVALSTLTTWSAPPERESGVLLVANKGDRTLGIIDPATRKQVAAVPENGITGHEVIASPDGKTAYVPIYGDSGVGKPGSNGTNMVAVDIASRKIVGNLDFGHGVRPHCPQFGPKNGLLYVSTELDSSISIIDPKALKVIGSVPTGEPESHMFVVSHDGNRAYTANRAMPAKLNSDRRLRWISLLSTFDGSTTGLRGLTMALTASPPCESS